MNDATTSATDPAPKGVGLSESAVTQLVGLFEAEDRDGLMLRIMVNGGGCSGFTYAFDFDDKLNDDDKSFDTDGVKVVVDDASLEFIDGSVLNYVESLGGNHFQLENPNATSSCGCGSSFSVY
ncbi:MAG: iron-sulfur cluster insertion protein ErpA [Alphaproteobacteria bacterium]|nr:iron-sulfur cluster insertion protein ErpA [Alphaproteobacteria bacterium]|tara:strand:- start:3756 stop:4124 length:369 start_codon:yes stop_codon:yes gene_type:complete